MTSRAPLRGGHPRRFAAGSSRSLEYVRTACSLLALACFGGLTDAGAQDYLTRKQRLPFDVLDAFVQDDCSLLLETALDGRTFSELLGLVGPKVLDKPDGWSVEARIGGRPFLCFDTSRGNGSQTPQFESLDFELGDSGIPRSEIDEYFAIGKTVNRPWFTHFASNGFPIVAVLTPDGLLNLGAALAPKLQGAACGEGSSANLSAPSTRR
jgi:hypothetical protein